MKKEIWNKKEENNLKAATMSDGKATVITHPSALLGEAHTRKRLWT